MASIASILLLCLGPAAAAHGEPHGKRRAPGSFAAMYAERLGLDADAQAMLEGIVEESGARDAMLRDELDTARQRMHDLMNESHHPDEGAVVAQAEAVAAVEAEIHKNRLRAILQIRHLLSPEQRQELLRLRDEKTPHGERRGRKHRGCSQDLGDHCPDARAGRSALACLDEHWGELSASCRSVFEVSEPGPDAR